MGSFFKSTGDTADPPVSISPEQKIRADVTNYIAEPVLDAKDPSE